MKIADSHSHLNGEEHLIVHAPEAYRDVKTAISQADGMTLRNSEDPQTRWHACSESLGELLRQRGWEDVPGTKMPCFTKGRVALGMHLGGSSTTPYEPFADHILLYTGDIINVGIEILPVRAMAMDTEGGRNLSSGIAYYEGEVYNVMRHGRNSPPVPLLIIGIAP